MIQDVLRAIDLSGYQTIATVLFVLCFAAVFYAVFRLSGKSIHRYSQIPLSDHVQDPQDD